MRKNRILHTALTLSLLAGLMTPCASAANFTDLNGHWSAPYVKDVANQGLVNGYDDGSFKPDNQMTYCEALIFCSRIADLSTRMHLEVVDKWEDDIMDVLPSSIADWAYREMSVCAELGIVSLDELEALDDDDLLTAPIPREALALYLTRALQLDPMAESLTSYRLSFGDTSSIGSDYRPYVYLLNSYDIILGDDEGNFNPKNSLSRGEMAALLSRAMDLIDDEDIFFELLDFTDYDSWTGGIISSVSTASTGATTLSITNELSGNKTVVIPASTEIYEFNMAASAKDFSVGDYVRLNYNKKGTVLSVIIGGTTVTNDGSLISLSRDSITVWGSEGYETYTMNDFTQVSTGGQVGDPSIINLDTEYSSAQCTVNQLGQLTSVILQGGSQTVDGVFYGTTTSGIQMTALDGIRYTYPMADDMSVTVDGTSYNFLYSSLAGKYITLYISNDTGEVERAQVDTSTYCAQGALYTFDEDDDPRTITVTDVITDERNRYDVADDAVFFWDGDEIDMDDLERFWFVTLLFDGKNDHDDVISVWCTDGSYYENGTLTAIKYGTSTTLDVILSDGSAVSYTLDLTDLPDIYRNGDDSSIDKLRSGDLLEIEVEYNEVARIDATSQDATLTATISSITKTSAGTTLEVELADGSSQRYLLSSGISITQDGKDIAVSSLEVDYEVSMVLLGDQVVSIDVEDTPSNSGVLSAMIISQNSEAGTFLVQLSDGSESLVLVDVEDAKFLSASTGYSLSFSKFDPGDDIQIHGSYMKNAFVATLVIML